MTTTDRHGPPPATLPPAAPIVPARPHAERLAALELDPRVIAWENAAHVQAELAEGLGAWQIRCRMRGGETRGDLDEPCCLLVTDNPRVLGETGHVFSEHPDPVDPSRLLRVVEFTARQSLGMAELLADALPQLAAEAHAAYAEAGIRPPGRA